MKSLLGKLGVLFIGLLIFGYSDVWGADWRYYGLSTDAVYLYDAQVITRLPNGLIRVWTKVIFNDQGRMNAVVKLGENFKDVESSVGSFELDCKDKRSKVISYIFIKSASENPVQWTGMKDASAESRKKQTRC